MHNKEITIHNYLCCPVTPTSDVSEYSDEFSCIYHFKCYSVLVILLFQFTQ